MGNNKCNMCGGTIIIQPGATYGICDSCGSKVDLNISLQEREVILKKEIIQKNELKKVNDEKQKCEGQLNSLENKSDFKKFNIIQTCLSAGAFILASIGTSLPENISNILMLIVMVAIIVSIVFLVRYTSYFDNKKGRVAIISVLELFTLGIYGAVAGIIQIIKLTNSEKEINEQKIKLNEKIRLLESEAEEIKKNSEFKL